MERLLDKLRRGWREVASLLDSSKQTEKMLLQALRRDYFEEKSISESLARESERIPYPHLRKKLLAIAAKEKRHAELLAAKIQELGGTISERASDLRDKRLAGSFSTTLDLLRILDEEKDEYREYLESAYLARKAGKHELTNLLRQIAEEERRHRQELVDIVTKLKGNYEAPEASPQHPFSRKLLT